MLRELLSWAPLTAQPDRDGSLLVQATSGVQERGEPPTEGLCFWLAEIWTGFGPFLADDAVLFQWQFTCLTQPFLYPAVDQGIP